MNLFLRLFLFAAMPSLLIFSACSQQNTSQSNQNQSNQNQSSQNQNIQNVSPPAQTATKESGFVYTADERGNSISVIDLATNQAQKIPISVAPHNIQISQDGSLLLVVGAPATGDGGDGHEHGGAVGKLLIFDTAKLNDAPAEVEIGKHPAHVVIDSQGKFIYATNSEDDTVSVVDAAQKKQVKTIATGDFPHGLRISPDGREIYTANVNDGTISVISAAEQKETARIPVGKAPVQVGFTPDGKRVYVSLRDENAVAVIDTATRQKIATVPVGSQPIQMFATPNGRFVYVANQGTEDKPDNTVSVIDTASNKVAATITTGKGAHGVVAGADGKQVFVANTFDDTVSVIDVASQKVVATIPVGDAPNGITFRKASLPECEMMSGGLASFLLLFCFTLFRATVLEKVAASYQITQRMTADR